MVPNVLFAASRDYAENVMPHLRFHGNNVTVQVLKELKCTVICYFHGRILNPTNLLNHVARAIY